MTSCIVSAGMLQTHLKTLSLMCQHCACCAGVERELYRYYKAETCGLDFEGMIADLEVACVA